MEEECDKPEDAVGRYVTWLEYEHRCKGIERTISGLGKAPKGISENINSWAKWVMMFGVGKVGIGVGTLALKLYYFDAEVSTKTQLYAKEVVQNASANTKLEIEKSKLELQLWAEDRMCKAVREEMWNALEAKRELKRESEVR
ncbi:hypothetical protein P167DRAFT_563117 [Morchella conica CCBAS932]|uniref:Uncharacterized protein n=1 Tax=Morchella conica CCBAS932 TaxID=1392247 RepID=A0A3N4LBY1_9PEZI|nr:hypothetical protein P167DRAFT_563117 [Morchella conica CCBAS932]